MHTKNVLEKEVSAMIEWTWKSDRLKVKELDKSFVELCRTHWLATGQRHVADVYTGTKRKSGAG